MATGRPELRPGRPLRLRSAGAGGSRALRAVAVLVGLVIAGAAFELGEINAGYNRVAAMRRESELEKALLSAQAENKTLQQRLTVLDTDARVKAEAYRRVESRLGDLQAKIQKQSEDIAFYQGIVGADQQAGLRVQDLELLAGETPGRYSLRLVLAQGLRANQRTSGRVELSVEGSRDGEPATLNLAELTGGQSSGLKFSFRYFQNLQTELNLPAGFDPRQLKLRLVPRGKHRKNVEESFDWQVSSG